MNDNVRDALLFKALGDETRLHVMELLRGGEKCACVLLKKVDIGQPTLSHHMKILVDSGIVSARKAGKWTYYSINPEVSAQARNLLERITNINPIPDIDDNVRCCE
ncbi:transcriptional regulator [Clostridia bacterium]|nr:transcriptional regulator [Clostridia bacterium]